MRPNGQQLSFHQPTVYHILDNEVAMIRKMKRTAITLLLLLLNEYLSSSVGSSTEVQRCSQNDSYTSRRASTAVPPHVLRDILANGLGFANPAEEAICRVCMSRNGKDL
jgi:hypothetical protein